MSALRQSSPLAAGLEIPCPILWSLTNASQGMVHSHLSTKLSRMVSIPEESWEPEDDACQPCSEQPDPAMVAERAEPTPAIAEYVAKMREGIRKQGERLQQEVEMEASTETPSSTNETKKVDFQIKIARRKRPAPLLLAAKVHGKDLFDGFKCKARQVTFALAKKPADKATRLNSPPPKRSPLSKLTHKGEKGVCSGESRGKRMLFPLTWSKQTRLWQSEAKSKIKSKDSAPPTVPTAQDQNRSRQNPASSGTLVQDDEEFGDEVALLSIRSLASSSVQSFDASHFYTPMVPSRWRREYKYRLEKSRFRKGVDFPREALSRSAGRVKYHASNVWNLHRRRSGWSKLE